MKLERRFLLRGALLVCGLALADVAIPRLLTGEPGESPPRWFGERHGDLLTFDRATIGGAAESIAQRTGFRAVAFPVISDRPFTGSVTLAQGGEAAIRELAAKTGLTLRQGGPHWVLVAGDEQRAH